jgi:hypothetical protein
MLNPRATAETVDDLCANPDVRRIAGWGSSEFYFISPSATSQQITYARFRSIRFLFP